MAFYAPACVHKGWVFGVLPGTTTLYVQHQSSKPLRSPTGCNQERIFTVSLQDEARSPHPTALTLLAHCSSVDVKRMVLVARLFPMWQLLDTVTGVLAPVYAANHLSPIARCFTTSTTTLNDYYPLGVAV